MSQSAKQNRTVYTIGYEGLTIESYINRLTQSNITILADVRRNPISRKHGFSKRLLSQKITDIGIIYLHIPELGIASSYRENLVEQKDYDNLFRWYKTEWLPSQKKPVDKLIRFIKLISFIDGGALLAITCFEKDYRRCHRSHLATWLKKHLSEGYKIKHL